MLCMIAKKSLVKSAKYALNPPHGQLESDAIKVSNINVYNYAI